MARYKVYVSDYDFPDLSIEESILEPIGAEVIGLHFPSGEVLYPIIQDADAILQQYATIDRTLIGTLKKCKIIARYGIGVDIVDISAAREHGIIITNVPDYCIEEVADHATSLSFMLMRNLPFYNLRVHEGSYRWQDWRVPISRYRGTIYGLLGFGKIAQNLSHKLSAFGFQLISYDPYVSETFMRTFGVKKVDLDQLFSKSRIVNVLCPYTTETHHIVGLKQLRSMSPDSYLVCVSRGKCVDNTALYEALRLGWIAGAALDDPEEEPMKFPNWTPDQNPLFQLDNCFFTPHVGYISQESIKECRVAAAKNVKAVLTGNSPINQVTKL